MKEDAPSHEQTSRRQFTKAIMTAAVAAPIMTSIACRQPDPSPPSPPKSDTPVPTGPIQEVCFKVGGGGVLDHIPPMGFDGGGGSLLIETTTPLKKVGSGYEDDADITSEDKLADIKAVVVITELAKYPYVTITRYSGLPVNSKLLLWYQFLKNAPGQDFCDYQPSTFTGPHQAQILGGNKAANRPLQMTFPEDLKQKEKTFKCKHPHKYRQADKQGNSGHFRVGQWQIVSGSTILFSDNVNSANIPEHFRFYVTFDSFNPHRV